MTWGEVLSEGQKKLKNAGISEYALDAWYLFEHVFDISRAQYFLCAGERAEGEKQQEFEAALERRAAREPLQHIIGTQEFMGLEFYVNRHVLIPRQDTETLVETVLSEHREKNISILDMCTGSGCIAVSLAALGGYAHVEAVDISPEALAVARKNAEKILGILAVRKLDWRVDGALGAKTRAAREQADTALFGRAGGEQIGFRLSDMFSAFDQQERFDVIVSNPPYIPSSVIEELEPEVRDFEPRAALDGTEDGLFFYRILASECSRFLKGSGSVYFEIGYDQGEAVKELLLAHGFKDTRVIKDLAGKDRVVCGKWQAVK